MKPLKKLIKEMSKIQLTKELQATNWQIDEGSYGMSDMRYLFLIGKEIESRGLKVETEHKYKLVKN